ncbi:MAG: cytochrome c3 family protein [Coriobacteriia bacterium]|nr:cytochrome c3 family protein [Coriobacteriia bacterium]
MARTRGGFRGRVTIAVAWAAIGAGPLTTRGWAERIRTPGGSTVLALAFIGIVLLSAMVPSQAAAATAHADADTSATADCFQCHKPHTAPTKRSLLADVDESEVCYVCHGDLGGSSWNVETSAANSFGVGMQSGHVLEDVTDPDARMDLTNSCTGCHGVHGDPDVRANLPANEEVAGATIDPADPRTWCLTCHNVDHAWYAGSETAGVFTVDAGLKAAYEALIQDPTRDTSNYPTLGTFPGSAGNTTYLASTHATGIDAGTVESLVSVPTETVSRVQGDCLWCHASHKSTATYDGLLGEYRAATADDAAGGTAAGEYAQACFECHGNSSGTVYKPAATYTDTYWQTTAGAPDVHTLVMEGGASSGHRILTDGAFYEAGSPLPCYECHNPHGSGRGNSSLFSDTLGASLDASTAEGVRRFCFTCHTTYDTEPVTGRPYGWDSTTASYAPVAADAEVVGLSRTASAASEENRLRLWQVSTGHDHDDAQDCLAACHGDVHAPMGSPVGATNCFDSSCHSALHGMVDDTTSYHHVLNSATPDQPPADGVYPVFSETTQELSCVSCHMDHTAWEGPGNAYNLRNSGLVDNPTASNTDEDLCLSCHSYTLSYRIYRSADGTNPTPDGQADNALYSTAVMRVEDEYWAASPHNYPANTYFADSSQFVGNCAKCHGTLEPGQYTETLPYSFTVHYSPEQRLLNALGQDRTSLAAPQTAAINEEDMCFRCHSNSTDKLGASDHDYYGTQPMSTANRAIGEQMDPANNVFGHKPATYYKEHLISSIDEPQAYLSANKHVECADCHNHHIVGKSRHVYGTDNRVSDAIQGVRGIGFAPGKLVSLALLNYPSTINYVDELEYKQWATYEYEVCFKCHSSANTNLASWGGDMVWDYWNGSAWAVGTNPAVDNWTNVAQDFNVGNNSRHPVFATLSGSYYATTDATTMTFISGYADVLSRGTSDLEAGQVSNGWEPDSTMVCSDCHGDSDAPIAMVWNGTDWVPNEPAVLAVPQGPHGSSVRFSLRGPATDWPTRSDNGALIRLVDLSDANYNGLFCANCHPKARITTNRAHSAATGLDKHGGQACIYCHTLVPHGGKVSRLIGDHETMPARLAYQGDLNYMKMSSYIKGASTKNTCSVVAGSSCDTHASGHSTTGNQTGGSWENW